VRVLLDTTYSRRAPFSGTAVYLERLAGALTEIDNVEVVEVSNRRRRPPSGGGIGSLRNLLADRWWTAVELPRLARRARADVIHHPLPAHARGPGVPQVVTLHDLAFERLPDCFDRRFRAYADRAHRRATLAADAVVCVSETTAADARELWGLGADRAVVAPLGPGQALSRTSAERTHFLYVGDAEPRKNVRTLTDAYALYRAATPTPLPLVLAGSATASSAGIEVHRQPNPEQLARLYAGAVALVHPSLYEGFGLTPLEAMAAGVPVIAAEAPGITETCAAAALYADPRSSASFAEAMTRVAADAGLRDDLAERGRRRAMLFSWVSCARAHVDAYSLAQKHG
jgi:glycosyltransferase involved in cell wall biosynthesis